jgi:hypothetical protein
MFLFFIPLIGVVAYVITRGDRMGDRHGRNALPYDEDVLRSVQGPAEPTGTTADQLQKLADVRDCAVISAAEFNREKAKILAV